MNFKILYAAMLVAVITWGCCPQDEQVSQEKVIDVTFRTSIASQPISRAESSEVGIPPTRYIIQYLDSQGNTVRNVSHTGEFALKLKYGERYSCMFWADNGQSYDVSDLTSVKIETQPSSPAYCGATEIQAGVSPSDAYDVSLTHAVAAVRLLQLSDFVKQPGKLTATISKNYSLNIASLELSELGSTLSYEFSEFEKESALKTIGTAYYIAPTNDATLLTMTFTMEGEDTSNEVNNVPLRRNHVTTIKGNFSDLYNSTIETSIDNNWKDGINNVELWDGVSVSIPAGYPQEKGLYITTPRELAWLAQETAKPGMTMEGYTFTLNQNIYLNNQEWLPIGTNQEGFKGTIEGAQYNIYGLKISKPLYPNIGLIAYAANGSKFRGFNVYGEISVTDPELESNIGGIIGKGAKTYVSNVGSYVRISISGGNSSNFGGVVGYAQDCDFFATTTFENINAAGQRLNVGGCIGNCQFRTAGTFNNLKNQSGTVSVSGGQYNNAGGLIGFVRGENSSKVQLNSCTNHSPVKIEKSKYSICGGIIGNCIGMSSSEMEIWVAENHSPTTVTESSNSFFGEIIGQAQVGDGYTLKLTQPRISETIVIGQCYISNEESKILYNSVAFAGENGSPLYK